MNHARNRVLILEYGTPIVNQSKSLAYSLCSVSKYVCRYIVRLHICKAEEFCLFYFIKSHASLYLSRDRERITN